MSSILRHITSGGARLTSVLALALSLQSCFTGIESTPKIADSEIKKQAVKQTPEDTYLNDIPRSNIAADFSASKAWIVTDPKIALTLDLAARNHKFDRGDTLRFVEFRKAESYDGRPMTDMIVATTDGQRFAYRLQTSTDNLSSNYEINVPFTVDAELIDNVRRLMSGKSYYLTTRSRYDFSDNLYSDRKYVPVTVDSVEAGNNFYPIRLSLTDDVGKKFRLYMSAPWQTNRPRRFANLLSLTDPHLLYPDIDYSTWNLIINERVAVGMTKSQCRLSLGDADNVDRNAGYSTLREIWTYKNGRYLIFSDGILESILGEYKR
ncbi:MAG: hypothetical protein NC111_06535 [Bacteroides sp.]|nr:hypothetical protein [Bacteroides sp.]MCM1413095.1 hypothetical protein [Bacteroides sp.]MCM1472163.1 hypothetical protein [Bacteroides sp.]